MTRSCPVGLFILALCLVACVCAHAVVSRDEAAKIVNEVQKSTKKELNDLKAEINNAIEMRNKAKTYKKNAEEAATEAEKAAKGNQEAMAIAETAKKASAEVLKLYPNAFDLADKYAESMKKLRTTAQNLDDRARTELFVSEWRDGDYTNTKTDADAIKAEAAAFHIKVQEAMKLYSAMEDAQKEMPNFVSAAQLARHHVDAIVAVAKIETLLKSADTDIELTEQKIAQISATEQEMKKLSDNSPKDLINYISHLHFSVQGELRSASYRVNNAKKARDAMLKIKAQAGEALVKVKAEKNVDNAESEAGDALRAVRNAEEQIEEIKKAVESATRSATDALRWKKDAVNELNKKPKKPDVTQDNDKTNSQDSANTHQPVQDTTESPTVIGTKKPTVTNRDQPGSGGTEPTQLSSSDSAMTVSVTVLLALIACAALH